MAKSKFSKRHIAGALLLSSTAIGAVASGTASANKVTDFLGNGLRKTGELVKSAANMVLGNKIGNKLDGHEQIVGTVVGTGTVGLLFALTYVTYRAIKAGVDYYVNKKNKNRRLNVIKGENPNYGIEMKKLNVNENNIIEVKNNNDKIENDKIKNDNDNENIDKNN